ncbi:hypothetical protein [Rhodopirellula halodulae]|uniref:hypothetical protein n=1 Tax=Rhodopirellula halodulae TaxID=2894198 RepID=UPI001E36CBAB|nr:hypothetical protein [Rhodopirellula sp. JC737]MCC9656081.1 hypothetical protein [Rhodopirellula sp. JC737]
MHWPLNQKLRLSMAAATAVLGLLVSLYAIWKPSTTAGDLFFLPQAWVEWLDSHGDFRTFVMSALVAVVPSVWLGTYQLDLVRGRWLLCVGLLLSAMEVGQIWIPSRGFGIPDLMFTLAGVAAVELAIRTVRWCMEVVVKAAGGWDVSRR